MITEKDLQEAIAECQGVRNPNASTCIKLAAFLTIQRELFGNSEPLPEHQYSYAPPTSYSSESEFGQKVADKDLIDIMPVMDELMQTLSVLHPKLYNAVLRKL